MNKHQYCAIATAIFGIAASAVLWTKLINVLPLPYVPESTVSIIDDFLTEFFRVEEEKSDEVVQHDVQVPEPLLVQEVTIESLGVHFARSVESTVVATSVVEGIEVTESAEEIEEIEGIKEIEEIEEIEEVEDVVIPLHASAVTPSELDKWELSPVWNLRIPSLGIRTPVLLPSMKFWSVQAWDMLEEQMQVGLNHGAVAYPHSAAPGTVGSLIVAGHSSPPDEKSEASPYGHLFATLPDIAVGQDIEFVQGGEVVRYTVESKNVVSPQSTDILLQQNDESILKLITCYPVGTTKNRMIITAKKVEL